MNINPAAAKLAETLEQLGDQKVVFAESCTCGMAAALLGEVPGISNYFCGSQVVYRDRSKIDWLGVDAEYLAKVTSTSVETSQELAISVLEATPEATRSAAITGHLGPVASDDATDGVVYLCFAVRAFADDSASESECFIRAEEEIKLEAADRKSRQLEAAERLLVQLTGYLQELCSEG